jgi:transcriptional regulator with PAS, ATPase and Fis domain
MADQYELPPVESFRRRADVVRIIRRRVSRRACPFALAVSSQIESQSRVVRKAPEQRLPQSAMTGIAVNAEQGLDILCRYAWPGNVRQLISTVERLAAKAGVGRVITTDHVRREIDLEQKSVFAPCAAERFPALKESETLTEYLCRATLTIYERERTRLGSHSAAAHRLGIHRTTLYDWLEWARHHMTR